MYENWQPTHRVSWSDLSGSTRLHRDFFTLEAAVRWLNEAILDYGYHDARLTALPRQFNAPRIRLVK